MRAEPSMCNPRRQHSFYGISASPNFGPPTSALAHLGRYFQVDCRRGDIYIVGEGVGVGRIGGQGGGPVQEEGV